MTPEEVARIARAAIADAWRELGDTDGFRDLSLDSDLYAEADRLTQPADQPESAASRFEGVKYVVWNNGPHEVVDARSPGPMATLRRANGKTYLAQKNSISPWHPEKDEKVREECDPTHIMTVNRVFGPNDYGIADENSPRGGLWYPLCALRPLAFAPDEQQPEFEDGELVVDADGDLRVWMGKFARPLDINGNSIREVLPPFALAREDEIVGGVGRRPAEVLVALRDHAKTIAREAKT